MGYTWACWICVGCHFRRQCNCSHRHRSCCPLRLIRCYVGDLRQTVGDLRQTAGDLRQTAGDLRQTGWVTRGVGNTWVARAESCAEPWVARAEARATGGWHVPSRSTCRAARAEPRAERPHVPSDRRAAQPMVAQLRCLPAASTPTMLSGIFSKPIRTSTMIGQTNRAGHAIIKGPASSNWRSSKSLPSTDTFDEHLCVPKASKP